MPEQTEQSPSLALSHYLVVLRRRWLVVALFFLLGVAAALAYLQLAQRQVTATTTVDVNVISTAPFDSARSAAELLDPATEQQIASSSSVAMLASDSLGSEVSARELRSGLETTLMVDATVMRISYTAGTAEQARDGADAVADAYLVYRTDRADDRKQGNIDNLTGRLDDLRRDLRVANRRLDRQTPGTTKYARIESDRQLISIEIDGIVTQTSQIQQIDTESGTVLTRAADNTVTYAPRRSLVLATGALGGLAIGLVAAFAVNTLDRRVRDRHDVDGAGAGPILSRLAAASASMPPAGGDLEALRVARERLLAAESEHRVVALIDRTRGPHPSDVPVNFSVVIAETSRVEVILADFPAAYVDELTEALELKSLRDDDLGETLGARRPMGLDVYLPHPDDTVLADGRTGPVRSLVGAERHSDVFTVIALPPTASAASRLAAARMAGSVVVVIEDRNTRIDDLAQVVTEVDEVGGHVSGVIVVPAGRTVATASRA